MAAREGHIDTLTTLLDKGANINMLTDRMTALHQAVNNKQIEIVRYLVNENAETTLAAYNAKLPQELTKDENILDLLKVANELTSNMDECDFFNG